MMLQYHTKWVLSCSCTRMGNVSFSFFYFPLHIHTHSRPSIYPSPRNTPIIHTVLLTPRQPSLIHLLRPLPHRPPLLIQIPPFLMLRPRLLKLPLMFFSRLFPFPRKRKPLLPRLVQLILILILQHTAVHGEPRITTRIDHGKCAAEGA